MKLRPLPISIYYILLMGVSLGFLLAIRTYIPFLYLGKVDGYTWTRYALPSIIDYTLWPFFVPFVYHNSYKWQFGIQYDVSSNTKAFLYALFICAFHETVSNVIYFVPLELLGWFHIDSETAKSLQLAIPASMINRVIEYVMIVFSLRAVDNYMNLKQSELRMALVEYQLTSAKLKALRMQLQPHFLFNTLNTISSLLDIDVSKARTVIARFGDVLRNILEAGEKSFIPLLEELTNMTNYLSIEQVRFSDRLEIDYKVLEDCLDVLVPSFILQPLVENVIKHGLAKTTGALKLGISSRIVGHDLQLHISDDGPGGQFEEAYFEHGVGLKNTRERLVNLYGSNSRLEIKGDSAGFNATLFIPMEVSG